MKNLLFVILTISLFACNQPATTENKSSESPQQNVLITQDTIPLTQQTNNDGFIVIPDNSTDKPSKEEVGIAKVAYESAISFYQEGKQKESIEQFNIVLQYYPEHTRSLYYLGKIYYDLKQYDLSLSNYEKAVSFNAGDSLSTLAIGQIFYEEKEFEKAWNYYTKAIEIAPGYALAYFNRGTLNGQLKRYQEALDDLTKSIDLDQNNPNSYMNRGMVYFFLKQMNLACDDWKKAASMGHAEGRKAVDIYCK